MNERPLRSRTSANGLPFSRGEPPMYFCRCDVILAVHGVADRLLPSGLIAPFVWLTIGETGRHGARGEFLAFSARPTSWPERVGRLTIERMLNTLCESFSYWSKWTDQINIVTFFLLAFVLIYYFHIYEIEHWEIEHFLVLTALCWQIREDQAASAIVYTLSLSATSWRQNFHHDQRCWPFSKVWIKKDDYVSCDVPAQPRRNQLGHYYPLLSTSAYRVCFQVFPLLISKNSSTSPTLKSTVHF